MSAYRDYVEENIDHLIDWQQEQEENNDDKKHIDFLKSIIRHLESNVKVSDTIVIHKIKEYIETIKENK